MAELNPVQKGLSGFLIIAFSFICGCPALLGLMLLSTFVYKPEVQALPDQYGRVWSPEEILIYGLLLLIVPAVLFLVAASKLRGK